MSEELKNEIDQLAKNPLLPRHIAIIMDGNGRWAAGRGLQRLAGHRAGREAVRATVRTSAQLGIPVLSLYTFSLENWKRPKLEVEGLMKFLNNVLRSEYLELKENNIRLRASGRLDMLPSATYKVLNENIEKLSKNDGMILNLCLSYGGRAEITDAAIEIAKSVLDQKLDIDEINEKSFSSYLYTEGLPDPDLMIRTGGEHRVSNFLLWQIAYAEIVVIDTLWPDFREEHLLASIGEYLGRDRRFGEIGRETGD